MALGGGNNVLFTGDYPGALVKSAARGISAVGDTADCVGGVVGSADGGGDRADILPTTEDNTVTVRAEAGVEWDDFVAWCVERGLWGVENLSAIPGTVGAAPIQNIGAYGAEAKDVISSVECFCPETGNFLTLAAEHCGFGYRDSVFKRELRGRVIVVAVNFELSVVPRPNLGYGALAAKVAEISGSHTPAGHQPHNMSTTPSKGEELARRVGAAACDELFQSSGENGRASEGLTPGVVRAAVGTPTGTAAGGSPQVGSPAGDGLSPAVVRAAVMEIRRGKLPDPQVTGNAGSFFKNPVVDRAVAERLLADYPSMPVYPVAEAAGISGNHTPAVDGPGTVSQTGARGGVSTSTASSQPSAAWGFGLTNCDAIRDGGTPTDLWVAERASRKPDNQTGGEKVKLAAGWLIDKAGWRGRREGRVGIHEGQALVVVNLGGATGAEVVEFSRRVRAAVRGKFGIEIEPEVNFV